MEIVMKLTLVCGEKGSGKTSYCLSKIEELKKSDEDAKAVIIVPEQFSYVFEKTVTEKFGGTGPNGIEVLTMTRMANRFLNRARKNYLKPSGKAMLVQNAVFKASKEGNLYAGCTDKPGFANTVTDVISQLKRNMITPEILLNTAGKVKNKMLSQKLSSVAEIYRLYEEENGGRFYDSDDDFMSLSDLILKKNVFKGTYIFVDEFSDFIPQHYKVLESILIGCEELSVTLPARKDSKDEILNIPKDTIKRLINIAGKNKCSYKFVNLNNSENPFESDEINLFYKNYSDIAYNKYVPCSEETKDIELFSAKNPYTEIEHTAKKIKRMCEQDDMRYRDFAVVCGDTNKYNHIIDAVFRDYDIPYFSDNKLIVTDHPIIMTILGIFDIFNSNWSFDAVFRYLKCGYVFISDDGGVRPFPRDDIDFLETYVQKKGIRGKKKWLCEEDWIYTDRTIGNSVEDRSNYIDEDLTERINNIRRLIIKPIKNLDKKLAGRNTAEKFARSLVEFLNEIYLYESLISETERLDEEGHKNEAEQCRQVWDILLDVINQSVVTLGNEKCSRKEYKEFIRAGLSACEIAIIPSSLDAVTVGSADTVRQKDMKVLFVAGAVRGDIPSETGSDTIFSDKEITELNLILEKDDLEIGQDSKRYSEQAEYKLYRVLFTARKKMFISYPVSNFEGEAQIPSRTVFDLRKLFPYIKYSDDVLNGEDVGKLSSKEAFEYYLYNRNNKNDDRIFDIYNRLNEKPEWKEKLKKINLAQKYKIESLKITPQNAEKIYKNYASYSVSRLNDYGKCPFAYFLKHGLKAKAPEVWQIQKFDLGSLMHYAICRYCEIVADDADDFEQLKNNWNNMTKEKSEEIIDGIMKDIEPKVISSLERDEAKVKYLLLRMTKTIKRSAETVRISLINGNYVAAELEKSFEIKLDAESGVVIKGTIDRIDAAVLEDGKKGGIRIIDYKSGNTDFSIVSICNMKDIQLIVYALCAMELYKEQKVKYLEQTETAEVTGIMYNKLRDDMKKKAQGTEDDDSEIMKLDGRVILDDENGENVITDNALFMDNELEENGASKFLDFKLNKNGTMSKFAKYLSRRDYENIAEYVKNNVIKTDKKIREGNIEILPCGEGDDSSCKFCDMAEICLFDININKTRKGCANEEEAWEIINKENEKNKNS
ncbi:MAG: PD-(D/E)XK nuclease family protein [Clostridia bacterium]|nr:PD-(D/E)XK nuclease family protein [Clostridia bacterium]